MLSCHQKDSVTHLTEGASVGSTLLELVELVCEPVCKSILVASKREVQVYMLEVVVTGKNLPFIARILSKSSSSSLIQF